jgi:hypothetical protein
VKQSWKFVLVARYEPRQPAAPQPKRPLPGSAVIGSEVNLVEWMKTGFWKCNSCIHHWQADELCDPVKVAKATCPKCQKHWHVKWIPAAF